MNLKGNMTQHR